MCLCLSEEIKCQNITVSENYNSCYNVYFSTAPVRIIKKGWFIYEFIKNDEKYDKDILSLSSKINLFTYTEQWVTGLRFVFLKMNKLFLTM